MEKVILNKKWYTSKTLWINAIAIVAVVVGKDVISSEMQVTILSVINIIVRAFTKSNITI